MSDMHRTGCGCPGCLGRTDLRGAGEQGLDAHDIAISALERERDQLRQMRKDMEAQLADAREEERQACIAAIQTQAAALPQGHLPGGRELFLFGLDSALRVVRARSWRMGRIGRRDE